MVFARTVQKAAKINKLRKILIEEKEYSINLSKGHKENISSRLKFRHAKIRLRRKIGRILNKIIPCKEGSKIHQFFYKLSKDGSCENFTLKSLVGFISGFLLTYIFFMIFVFQLNMKFGTATIMCSIIGGVLTTGLAFSYKIRCLVLLLLPTFFSKRGRQALLAYAFILSITGPAKNTLNNMGILNESLACGQEQLKSMLKQILEAIKKPFYAIKDALKSVVKTVKAIVKKIKEVLLAIKRIILGIVKVIKSVFMFLAKIFSICNKEVGTPFERCSRAFEDAISDCNAKLGPFFNWLCSITYLVKGVCYIVKILDYICLLVDFISNSVVGVILRRVKIFVLHMKTMFYVRIKFSHSFHFETNQSKTMSDVTAGIATEIKNRTQRLVQIFDIMTFAASMFFVFAIFKVIYYRYQFLTSETFDNRYITKDFRLLDMRRAQIGIDTILPLNHRERKKYISSTSIRLVHSEKRKLTKAAMVLIIATIKMIVYILVDYALWWTLKMIRYHARYQSKVKAPNTPMMHITGKGFIAKLLRSIVTAFQPVGIQIEIDTIPCLPDPIPPDFDRYIQIGSCIILCWILAILEPYGLRMRHCVMCYYHPVRAKERAIWLYNHILGARRSFLKFARRQLRRRVMGDKSIQKQSCWQFISNHLLNRCPLLRFCIKVDKVESCLLCGERLPAESSPVRCQTPGCPGIYCKQCFNDLKNVCTICQDPIEYGDYSDMDEEKDSSEEEFQTNFKLKPAKKADGNLENQTKDASDSKNDSDSSSGYSESYQSSDRIPLPSIPQYSPRLDVEKQDIPTYASMQMFDDHDTESGSSDLPSYVSIKSLKLSRKRSASEKSSSARESPTSRRKRKSRKPMRRSKRAKRRSSRDTENESESLLKLGMHPLRKGPTKNRKRRRKRHGRFHSYSPEIPSYELTTPPTTSTEEEIASDNSSTEISILSSSSSDTTTELTPLNKKKLVEKETKQKHKTAKTKRDVDQISIMTPLLETPEISSDESSSQLLRSNRASVVKGKLIKQKYKKDKSQGIQASNLVSRGTSAPKLTPSPPSLPASLINSPRFAEKQPQTPATNVSAQTSTSSKQFNQKKVKISPQPEYHLRGGEDFQGNTPSDHVKRFLTGPRKFRLPVGRSTAISPMLSHSTVISELKCVLGQKTQRTELFSLPLPRLPDNKDSRHLSENTFDPLFLQHIDKIENNCSNRAELPEEQTFTNYHQRSSEKHQISPKFNTSYSFNACRLGHERNIQTQPPFSGVRQYPQRTVRNLSVRDRVNAYENTISSEQQFRTMTSNYRSPLLNNTPYNDSEADFYLTPQRNSNFRYRSFHQQVPRLNLVSNRDVARNSTPDRVVDHHCCRCKLTQRVHYRVDKEKKL